MNDIQQEREKDVKKRLLINFNFTGFLLLRLPQKFTFPLRNISFFLLHQQFFFYFLFLHSCKSFFFLKKKGSSERRERRGITLYVIMERWKENFVDDDEEEDIMKEKWKRNSSYGECLGKKSFLLSFLCDFFFKFRVFWDGEKCTNEMY